MHEFTSRLAQSWPSSQWQDLRVVVAVSGGPDSVALLRGLFALRPPGPGRVLAAHFNHRLRGAESDADETFVRDLCRTLGIECRAGSAAAGEISAGDSLEASARQARYRFLRAVARSEGARYVVTGHTADDQVETILHRILRGTALSGLSGMPRARPLDEGIALIRPLLEMTRAEVLAYLAALGQPYRSDATNARLDLTRSRIRHDLLPLLERDYNAGVREALLRLGELAGESQRLLALLLERHYVATRGIAGGFVVDCRRLRGEPRHLVRELLAAAWRGQDWPLKAMGFAQWDRLAGLVLDGEERGKQSLPGGIVATRSGDELTLVRGT